MNLDDSYYPLCPICNQKIDRPSIGLPDPARTLPLRLMEYCEYDVHQDCLIDWPDRLEFSKAYFEDALIRMQNPRYGHVLIKTEDWLLYTGPRGPHITPDMDPYFAELTLQIGGRREDTIYPFFASVRLRDWPFRVYSLWDRWTEYINGGYRRHYIPEILTAIDGIMAEVHSFVPTVQALQELSDRQG